MSYTYKDDEFEEFLQVQLFEKVEFSNQKILTPLRLCHNMLGRKEIRAILSTKGKILVINNVEFVKALNQLKVDMSRIWFSTDSAIKGYFVSGLFGDNVTVVSNNILNWSTVMKFDVIVGNPPYQAGTTSDTEKQGNFWYHFLTKSIDLCNDDGIIALITPKGWASIGNYSTKSYKLNLFKSMSTIFIDVSDKLSDHFKGIGSSFSYYIIRKNNDEKILTTIVGSNGVEFDIDLKAVKVFPFEHASKLTLSILDKTITSDEYNFTEGKDKNIGNKKIYLIAGRFVTANQIKLDSTGNTQDSYKCSMPLSNLDIGAPVFQLKLFRFVFKCLGGESGQNGTGIMKKLPYVDLTRSWTDEQLYKHFKLTKKEIELIEQTIK